MNGTAPEINKTAEKIDVEASRTKRLERVKAKQRDRGGIFKPSESNPLIDILMTRTLPTKSPMKPPHSKAGKLKSSRKSIGVPKTPKKSVANRSSVTKKSSSSNQNDVSEIASKGKTAAKTANGRSKKSAASRKVLAVASPTAEPWEVEKEAGPSAPRWGSNNSSNPGTSRGASHTIADATIESDEDFNPKPKSRKGASRPRKTTNESKAQTSMGNNRNKLTKRKGKGKSQDNFTDVEEQEQASSVHDRKGKGKRIVDAASSDNDFPTARQKKRSKSENDAPGDEISAKPLRLNSGVLDTIAEEEDFTTKEGNSKRRLEDEDDGQRAAKKARKKGGTAKKTVSFAPSPEKVGTTDKGEEDYHQSAAKTKPTKPPKTSEKEISKKRVKRTPSRTNPSDDERSEEVENTPPKPMKSYSSTDKTGTPALDLPSAKQTSEKQAIGPTSAQRKATFTPGQSLSARPRSKPDMAFKMRSVSYPTTLLGSPLKALDSEQDPLDLL